MKKGLILFDADHTLYDIYPEKAYGKLYKFLAPKTGKTPEEISSAHQRIVAEIKTLKNPAVRTLRYSLSRIIADEPIVKQAYKIFWKQILQDLKAKKNLRTTLARLAKNYDLAIFSDSFREELKMKLGKTLPGWKKYFSVLITPETTGEMKPSGKYCLEAMKLFPSYAPGQITAVGDSWERDLKDAAGLGIKTILIPRKKSVFRPEKSGRANFTIEDLKQLPELL